jgi:cobyrinic acid a,c-diamide synthase
MRAFVLAGTHSGCGKTTLTLGLLAALKKKGLTVQPFKVGPDFIDTGLHRLATGRVSRNLDLWMCGEAYVHSCFHRHSSNSDVAVIEGVMGLYDGDPNTATLAASLGLPVILVVDAYGMAESAGPLVKGFRDWSDSSRGASATLGGVIFNRVASERHFDRLSRSVRDVPVLGYLPRDLRFEIPHRHLGLVTAEEQPISMDGFERLAATVLEHIDVDLLLESCRLSSLAPERKGEVSPATTASPPAPPVRVAVALDQAFCFYYRDNLDLLESSGAEIVPFSPLSDAALPGSIDAVYLGGGYPELHAAQLASNQSMRTSLKEWALGGGPVYGECGGFMYLCRALHDFEGRVFDMAGVFPFDTEMVKGRAHLGYRQVDFVADCPLGRASQAARGHEFHYSRVVEPKSGGVGSAYRARSASGEDLGAEGFRFDNVLGSYTHIHFGSNPAIAGDFIAFARDRRFS